MLPTNVLRSFFRSTLLLSKTVPKLFERQKLGRKYLFINIYYTKAKGIDAFACNDLCNIVAQLLKLCP